MLQQTQVNTVIPYYNNFIAAFPTISALAEADPDSVLKRWEGLGYYSRARNLHAAAINIYHRHNGKLPATLSELKKLSGIGEYTAAAILSIAFNKPAAAVDGNIKRVFSRLKALPEPVNQAASTKVYQRLAEQLLSHDDPGDYNQALMDLGALICKPRNPDCKNCPLSHLCEAKNSNRVSEFPVVIKKSKVPTHRIAVAVVIKRELLLITKRGDKGLLGGLWEFPGGKLKAGEKARDACLREVEEETGLKVELVSHLTRVKHAYTHFKIEMEVFICRFVSGSVRLSGPVDYKWIELHQIDEYPFPKANHKFIPLLKKTNDLCAN